MVEYLQPLTFAQGEFLMEEGDTGDCMYIIVSGTVEITKTVKETKDSEAYEQHIVFLHAAQCVGDSAIKNEQ